MTTTTETLKSGQAIIITMPTGKEHQGNLVRINVDGSCWVRWVSRGESYKARTVPRDRVRPA